MTLNEFVAKSKREILEDIVDGRRPRSGSFDAARLEDLRSKALPQMGTTVVAPESVTLEFIFAFDDGSTEVLLVTLEAPERIVYLPVPEWVIESVWQGEVAGSFHFESHARQLLKRFETVLEPSANKEWFHKRPPKRRE